MTGELFPEQDLRRTRHHITAAFAATLVGLVGLTLLSAQYLWGLAESSSIVAERSVPAIQHLAEIRGNYLRARTTAREAIDAEGAHRETLHAESLAALQRIDDLLKDPVAVQLYSKEEQQNLESLRDRARTTINEVFEHLAQGDNAGAGATLSRTRPDTERTDATIQADIFSHSEEASRIGTRLHLALRHFVFESLVLTLIGFIGAFVLLTSGVHSLRLLVVTMAGKQAIAEERAAELDAFAARVAHDLRGPLTAMRVSLETAMKRSEPPVVATLQRANNSITTLDQMIGDLLDFARSSAQPPAKSACAPAEVIPRVLSELQPMADARGIAFSTELSAFDPAAIEAGPFRMIVFNIVENAIKYMGNGSARRIQLSLSRVGERLRLEVRDTGIGVAPEALGRLFEPFFRASSAAPGYGLGLATVKRLVDAHRGEIGIESTVGQGTCVRLTLPVVPQPSAANAEAA